MTFPSEWAVYRKDGELIDHLSPSSLSRFMSCPESWRLHYLIGEPEPQNIYAAWGICHHEALAENYLWKIETGYDLPEINVVTIFTDQLKELVTDNPDLDWRKETPERVAKVGVSLIRCYMRSVSPLVRPLHVEKEHNLSEGFPVPIRMILDLETSEDIIDYKTASRPRKTASPSWLLQAACYQLAVKKPLAWHVAVKQEPPFVLTSIKQDYSPARCEDTRRTILFLCSQIQNLYDRYGTDEEWPGTGMHLEECWKCSFDPCYWRRHDV